MLVIKTLLFILISNICIAQSKLDPFFFIGPMVHYNINTEKNKFSFSLEGSAWFFIKDFPLPPSIDVGIEFERKKFRLYSELQTGSLIGMSIGPVLEISDKEPTFGVQSSLWASFFAGVDFRYRRINKSNYYAPGMFFKAPFLINNNTGF